MLMWHLASRTDRRPIQTLGERTERERRERNKGKGKGEELEKQSPVKKLTEKSASGLCGVGFLP